MNENKELNQLIIPIYINEKIVIDMLAIIEDGFSKVSQINYIEHKENDSKKSLEADIGIPNFFGKLLKIDLAGNIANANRVDENESISKEKVHTNASLLSKFRSYLINKDLLKFDFDIEHTNIGDFVEIRGTLQKNPLIDSLEKFVGVFKMADIFSEKTQLSSKNKSGTAKQQNHAIISQIKSFSDELKHSGTIDFILSDAKGTIVLSTQEQYLSNDNISEIIGGSFKVLGKVIAICKDDSDNISLLRKTTLSLLSEGMLEQMFAGFNTTEHQELNLPEFKTKISGPALIVIPIAIYA